jgi:hypothetical protein
VTPWLAEVYTLVAESRTDQAIDRVFDEIDELLLAGDFATVDEILLETDLARLNSALLVGFLTITLAAKKRLLAREDFVTRIEQRLRTLQPEHVESLMNGLR